MKLYENVERIGYETLFKKANGTEVSGIKERGRTRQKWNDKGRLANAKKLIVKERIEMAKEGLG